MSAGLRKRREERWARRYARSQKAAEAANGANVGGLARPDTPAAQWFTGADGATYCLQIVPPGEPVTHVGRYAVGVVLTMSLTRGLVVPTADNSSWAVVLQRQRGPWRGFDTVVSQRFGRPAEAAARAESLRRETETGRHPS